MQAIPDPKKLAVTIGVKVWAAEPGVLKYLMSVVEDEFKKQPDECTDGGNDKFFFSFAIGEQRFFAAANEVNGLTVMFPEEY